MVILLGGFVLVAWLLVRIFKGYKSEGVPSKLFRKFLIAGGIVAVIVVISQIIIEFIPGCPLGSAFAESLAIGTSGYYAYLFMDCFFAIALVEEGLKFIAMRYVIGKYAAYNRLYDGLMYSVLVTLGFSLFENVLYMFVEGPGVIILRTVISLPAHITFAVIMGNYYSKYHLLQSIVRYEKKLESKGIINVSSPEQVSKSDLYKCLIVPILVHGLYDFLVLSDSDILIFLAIIHFIVMYVYTFKSIKKQRKSDRDEQECVNEVIANKYPGVIVNNEHEEIYTEYEV